MHLCSEEGCVQNDWADGRAFRIHVVALHLLYKQRLNEGWYREAVETLESMVERVPTLPRMRLGPAVSGAE